MALSRRPTILVLRALGLGDFLTGVPALRALRRNLPGHRVFLAAPAALSPLADLVGAVDELHPASGLQPLDWSDEPPDLAVNLHGKGPQSHRLLADLSPGRLVAFANPTAGASGPTWCASEHEVDRWCRLLHESLHFDVDPTDLLLPSPAVDPPVTGAVVIHPGAASPSRRWPVERYAEVARWATSSPNRVVVTGSSDERPLASTLCEAAALPAECNLAGRTSLLQLAALVASAELVISGDTGVAHLATAFATRSVLVFGPTSPTLWGPRTCGPHRVLWQGPHTGDPHGDRVDPALLALQPADVIAAAVDLLDHAVASARLPAGSPPSTLGLEPLDRPS